LNTEVLDSRNGRGPLRALRAFTFDEVDDEARAYAPSEGRLDRLSIVLWARDLDDPSPLFVNAADGHVTTVVAVWPCLSHGAVDPLALTDVEVLPWTMSPDEFADLRSMHRDFHLGRHDLLVEGGPRGARVGPAGDSVYRKVLASRGDVARRISDDIADAVIRWRVAA
jgi:hypothetical protein